MHCFNRRAKQYCSTVVSGSIIEVTIKARKLDCTTPSKLGVYVQPAFLALIVTFNVAAHYLGDIF